MNVAYLLRGVLIGLAIAAPVGPVGILIIRRTLASGRRVGLCSGLGVATADTCYGAVAALGMSAVSRFLVSESDWIRFVGGVFLLYLGATTALARTAGGTEETTAKEKRGLVGAYISAFFVTMTNPATILSFAAVFAGLGLTGFHSSQAGALSLLAGISIGSSLWWLVLTTAVGAIRSQIDSGKMVWVNRATGVVLALFGLGAIISAAQSVHSR